MKMDFFFFTSKWLFACIDHSSRFANIRPHNSHVQDNGWFGGWFCIGGIFDCWLCIVLWWRLLVAESWCKCVCIIFCLFSLFVVFFLLSNGNYKMEINYFERENRENFRWKHLPSEFKLFNLLPNGAIFVGVTCLNLFIWITNLSRRANALSQTYNGIDEFEFRLRKK